ncbi:hypothetical protein [Desulfobacula sp.]|uniref:hypothetical protein n=1 Tax=Desulfobacula sp. TaxID=2593537 RepID=UPI0025C5D6D6|nr:hypothetical protein [Desulfobacula sp.]MBC2705142.1 hypothetical protein [Desulfobacula sp.]
MGKYKRFDVVLYHVDSGLVGILIGSLFSITISLHTNLDKVFLNSIFLFLAAIVSLVFYMNVRNKISMLAAGGKESDIDKAFTTALNDNDEESNKLNYRKQLYIPLIVSFLSIIFGVYLLSAEKKAAMNAEKQFNSKFDSILGQITTTNQDQESIKSKIELIENGHEKILKKINSTSAIMVRKTDENKRLLLKLEQSILKQQNDFKQIMSGL